MKRISIYIVLLTTLFVACSTKIELNAPEKDITIVYGLINPSESVNYIKINKAYLTEGDINQAAAVKGITQYGENDLNVTLEEYDEQNGQPSAIYQLARVVNENVKDPGLFDNSENVLFKLTQPIKHRRTYKLIIKNKLTNKLTESSTKTVGELSIQPLGSPKVSLTDGNGNFINDVILISSRPLNSGRIEAEFIFNFSETFNLPSGGKNTVDNSFTFKLGSVKTTSSDIRFSLNGEDVFKKLEEELLPIPSNLDTRTIKDAEYIFYTAGEELNTYMTLDEPGGSVFSRVDYTNITNGIGLFSSRSKTVWSPEDGSVSTKDYLTITLSELKKRFRLN